MTKGIINMITPDNFKGDPLGWGGNQAGHMFICGVASLLVAVLFFRYMGEYPQKEVIWAIVAAGYLAIELPQRGTLWDSLEDLIFVLGYGAAFYIVPFDEMAAGDPYLKFNPYDIIPAFFVLSVHFMIGIIIRVWQKVSADQ